MGRDTPEDMVEDTSQDKITPTRTEEDSDLQPSSSVVVSWVRGPAVGGGLTLSSGATWLNTAGEWTGVQRH